MLKTPQKDHIPQEIILDKKKVIMSKTDPKGIISYANNYFMETAGYTQEEIIKKPHNIIRHPDMPKVVFKLLWEKLHKGENLYAVVKNLTKDGNYYWVVTKFETTFDSQGDILAHYARRKFVPKKVRETAESIYSLILEIEKHDPKLAEKTFDEVLESQNLTYDDFFLEVAEMTKEEIENYFLSTEMNTNTSDTNIINEIDSQSDEDKLKLLSVEIDQLKEKINSKTKSLKSNNFFGNLTDDLKSELSALQKKDSL